MIFDYVDGDERIPPSVVLSPAQRLHQTRRSMDLEGTPPRYPFPAFVIAGVSRCSDEVPCEFETPEQRLLQAILQHPLSHPSHHADSFAKAGNFLDLNWNYGKANEGDLSREESKGGKQHGGADLIALRRQYLKHFDVPFLKPRASLVTGELGATYLRHGELAARRLKAIAPATKVIVVLPDPELRAQMHFQDLRTESKVSFDNLIEADVKRLRQAGIQSAKDATPELFQRYWKTAPQREAVVGASLYGPQLKAWRTYFPELLLLQPDGTAAGLQRDLDRVSSFLGLPDSHELESEASTAKPFSCSSTSDLLRTFFQGHDVGSFVKDAQQ